MAVTFMVYNYHRTNHFELHPTLQMPSYYLGNGKQGLIFVSGELAVIILEGTLLQGAENWWYSLDVVSVQV